ncbi:phosphatidylglycerophosphatase A [Bacteriovorax sp. Seq25_V]|uniref:phosphatidylglycerophosphatase A family protein n=1 Tax=Bacteriovorax sp. Seq25_V TaxID=1201288 RepID=UPI000389F354|nr:phosphatidylglycerophosphatase A [Bacteriovorax sp. Seq25_V]EQC43221.1 phosphatidylglycerophosphatase A [Bacteriovorax sp. Seq25_V]
MLKENKPPLNDPAILFLTCLGAGYSPYAPGTVGSLAILLPLYFLGQMNPPFFLFIPFISILSLMSIYIINIVEKKHKIHDPGWIVIDEVVGMWIACLFLTSHSAIHYFVAFIWFRCFDILKPWPVSYFDKLESAFGTLFDDVVAGLMGGASYLLTFKLLEVLS